MDYTIHKPNNNGQLKYMKITGHCLLVETDFHEFHAELQKSLFEPIQIVKRYITLEIHTRVR